MSRDTKSIGIAYEDQYLEGGEMHNYVITGSSFDDVSAAELAVLDGASSANNTTGKVAILGTNGALTIVSQTTGAITGTDDASISKTLTGASVATERLTRSAMTLTPTSTVEVAAGGSLAGVRGEITLTAAKTFTDGFLFGTQGKFTMNGTMAEVAAARAVGVLGQVDLSTGTLTAGQISAVWGDLQGNPTLTVNDQLYIGRFTNSMSSGKKAQAFFLTYGEADFLLEAGAGGGSADWFSTAGTPGSVTGGTGWLKVIVNGETRYIPLASSVS